MNERKSRFAWMTDDELARFEAVVQRAFDPTVHPDELT